MQNNSNKYKSYIASLENGGLSSSKARKILHHGKIRGKPITAKQRRFFGSQLHDGGPVHNKTPHPHDNGDDSYNELLKLIEQGNIAEPMSTQVAMPQPLEVESGEGLFPLFESEKTSISPLEERSILDKETKEQIHDEKFVDYVKDHPSEFLPGTEAYKKLNWDLQGYIMGNVIGTDLLHIPKFLFTLGLPQDEDFDRNVTWPGRAESAIGAANWTMAGEIFGGGMGWTTKKLTPGIAKLESKISSLFKPKQIEPVSTKPLSSLDIYNALENPLQVRALMPGNKLENAVSKKTGKINTNQLKDYINSKNVNKSDKTVMQKVFDNMNLSNQKVVSLDRFKLKVNEELVPLTAVERSFTHTEYGIERLGYSKPTISGFGMAEGYQIPSSSPATSYSGISKTGTVTYSNPGRFGKGSSKHNFGEINSAVDDIYTASSGDTQGWGRYMVTKESPNTVSFLEMQSDAAQGFGFEATLLSHAQKVNPPPFSHPKSPAKKGFNAKTLEIRKQQIHDSIAEHKELIKKYVKAKEKIDALPSGVEMYRSDEIKQHLAVAYTSIANLQKQLANIDQKWAFYGNFESRLFQENMKWASKQGYTKMRYPTAKTASIIQNYQGGSGLITWPQYGIKLHDLQKSLLETRISAKDFLAQVKGTQMPHYEILGDVKIVRTFPDYPYFKPENLVNKLEVKDAFSYKTGSYEGLKEAMKMHLDPKFVAQYGEIRVYRRNPHEPGGELMGEQGWEFLGQTKSSGKPGAGSSESYWKDIPDMNRLKQAWQTYRQAGAPEFNIKNFSKEQQSVLRKYDHIPRIAKESGITVKTITGPKGNTWYEFDIPYGVQSGTTPLKAFKKYGGPVLHGNSVLPKYETGGDPGKYNEYITNLQDPITQKKSETPTYPYSYSEFISNEPSSKPYEFLWEQELETDEKRYKKYINAPEFEKWRTTQPFKLNKKGWVDVDYYRKNKENKGMIGNIQNWLINKGKDIKWDKDWGDKTYQGMNEYLMNEELNNWNYTNFSKDLYLRQIYKESTGKQNVVSGKGAKGLAQFLPKTWKEMQRTGLIPETADINSPVAQVYAQRKYMDWLWQRPGIKESTTLSERQARSFASYNMGLGKFRRFWASLTDAEKKGGYKEWYKALDGSDKGSYKVIKNGKEKTVYVRPKETRSYVLWMMEPKILKNKYKTIYDKASHKYPSWRKKDISPRYKKYGGKIHDVDSWFTGKRYNKQEKVSFF